MSTKELPTEPGYYWWRPFPQYYWQVKKLIVSPISGTGVIVEETYSTPTALGGEWSRILDPDEEAALTFERECTEND